jgi:hypothetical protein
MPCTRALVNQYQSLPPEKSASLERSYPKHNISLCPHFFSQVLDHVQTISAVEQRKHVVADHHAVYLQLIQMHRPPPQACDARAVPAKRPRTNVVFIR